MTDFFDGARPDTFRCQAFVNMILDIIYRSGSPKVLTDGLEVICNAPEKPSESAPFVDSNTLSAYKEKLYEEVRSNQLISWVVLQIKVDISYIRSNFLTPFSRSW